jgi:hypothetical protein
MFKNSQALSALKDVESNYCIIKPFSGLTNPKPGKDIDILCADAIQLSKELIPKLSSFIDIETELLVQQVPGGVHIDIEKNGILLLKYDLIDSFVFRRNHIRPSFAKRVLKNKTLTKFGKFSLFVADPEDDAAIRWWAYEDSGFTKLQHKKYWQELSDDSTLKAKSLLKKYGTKRWWWPLDSIRSRLNGNR